MSITKESELVGMKNISEVVATTLKQMREYAKAGMTTKELDNFGEKILESYDARPAPTLEYGFPGCTCISLNNEIAHGVPSNTRTLKDGDLLNIDVSAELDGFWSDNGGSFVVGKDLYNQRPLVDASKQILKKAINSIKSGVRISNMGQLIKEKARRSGYKVIKNLGGHGIGRSLHEEPDSILNFKNRFDYQRFKKNSVVAIETFISTTSTLAIEQEDGWTLVGNNGGYNVQHEHTIVITDDKPIILTAMNKIWN